VGTAELADEGVTAGKIAPDAVQSAAIATGAVGSDALATDAVTANAVASGAVGTGELADAAVTESKLGSDAVTADKIATGAVGTDALVADAVTADIVASGAIGTSELADASLAAADINVAGTPANGNVLAYNDTQAGSLIWQDPSSTTSSIRFKTDVQTISEAQTLVDHLRGVRYHWKADGRPDLGLIAEEVAAVLPELVTYEEDGTTVRGLRYGPLVAVLIEAAKTQGAELANAHRTIVQQESEIESLSDRLARLESLVYSMQDTSAETVE